MRLLKDDDLTSLYLSELITQSIDDHAVTLFKGRNHRRRRNVIRLNQHEAHKQRNHDGSKQNRSPLAEQATETRLFSERAVTRRPLLIKVLPRQLVPALWVTLTDRCQLRVPCRPANRLGSQHGRAGHRSTRHRCTLSRGDRRLSDRRLSDRRLSDRRAGWCDLRRINPPDFGKTVGRSRRSLYNRAIWGWHNREAGRPWCGHSIGLGRCSLKDLVDPVRLTDAAVAHRRFAAGSHL